MKILFITWDGPQVSYLETLFLPIFSKLAEKGFIFHVLQFTWGDASRIEQSRKACLAAGFAYESVLVKRWPKSLGAFITAVVGVRRLREIVRTQEIDLLLPRSTLPGLTTLLAMRTLKCAALFDADGLPLDERVEFAGQSASGLAHRFQRDIEAEMVRRANAVIVRTPKAADILLSRAGAGTDRDKFYVVSNGRDSDVFGLSDQLDREELRSRLGVMAASPLVVYAGSLGGKYRFPEMLQLFRFILARCDDARFLVLTGSPQEARAEIARHAELSLVVDVRTVLPEEVPRYLGCADLGLALIQSSFSMQAVSAVKLGEYFLCGLPVVATRGIGDSNNIPKDVGFLLDEMDLSQLEAASNWFVNEVLPDRVAFSQRCRRFGELNYSLDACADSYVNAFGRALENSSAVTAL